MKYIKQQLLMIVNLIGLVNFLSFNILNFNQQAISTISKANRYQYGDDEKKELKKEAEWCQKYFNQSMINPYKEFIWQIREELQRPASNESKYQFDCLFDNKIAPRIWYNFEALNRALTTKRLSNEVTTNINWNQLYQRVGLNDLEIDLSQGSLLRFYNIISKLYGKENVLRLVQSLTLDNNLAYFGQTNFDENKSAINITLNGEFANQTIIDYFYQTNEWSTNSRIIEPLHQYAKALSYYVINSNHQRQEFNKQPFSPTILQNSNQPQLPFNNSSIFHDVCQNLMNYLTQFRPIAVKNDQIKLMLFRFLIIDSRFSRVAWLVNGDIENRIEFFDEAFAKWIGTSGEKRHYDWEILNNYFMNFFRQHFDL